MAESVKVPEDEFRKVLKALLEAPPTPMSDIPKKRQPSHPKSRRSAKKTR